MKKNCKILTRSPVGIFLKILKPKPPFRVKDGFISFLKRFSTLNGGMHGQLTEQELIVLIRSLIYEVLWTNISKIRLHNFTHMAYLYYTIYMELISTVPISNGVTLPSSLFTLKSARKGSMIPDALNSRSNISITSMYIPSPPASKPHHINNIYFSLF